MCPQYSTLPAAILVTPDKSTCIFWGSRKVTKSRFFFFDASVSRAFLNRFSTIRVYICIKPRVVNFRVCESAQQTSLIAKINKTAFFRNYVNFRVFFETSRTFQRVGRLTALLLVLWPCICFHRAGLANSTNTLDKTFIALPSHRVC